MLTGYGNYRSQCDMMLGGRDGKSASNWDGLIADVRLTAAILPPEQLLINGQQKHDKTVGYWRFETNPGFYKDSSGLGNDIVAGSSDRPSSSRSSALVDFCHVLLNSNEFLYID